MTPQVTLSYLNMATQNQSIFWKWPPSKMAAPPPPPPLTGKNTTRPSPHQGFALRKIEGSPAVLWTCEIQAHPMISKKTLSIFSCPGAKVRHQGPPDAARVQPCQYINLTENSHYKKEKMMLSVIRVERVTKYFFLSELMEKLFLEGLHTIITLTQELVLMTPDTSWKPLVSWFQALKWVKSLPDMFWFYHFYHMFCTHFSMLRYQK